MRLALIILAVWSFVAWAYVTYANDVFGNRTEDTFSEYIMEGHLW